MTDNTERYSGIDIESNIKRIKKLKADYQSDGIYEPKEKAHLSSQISALLNQTDKGSKENNYLLKQQTELLAIRVEQEKNKSNFTILAIRDDGSVDIKKSKYEQKI